MAVRHHYNPFEPETIVWQKAIIAAGSSVSPTSLTAHNDFIKSSKTKGYRSRIHRLNTEGAVDLAGLVVPIINDFGGATDINHNFSSGDFVFNSGLTGDGATKYLEGVYNPSLYGTLNNSHFGIVVTTYPLVGGNDMGSATDGSNVLQVAPIANTGTGSHNVSVYNNTNISTNDTFDGTGFWLFNRRSATDLVDYRNGVQKHSSSATSPGQLPNANYGIGCVLVGTNAFGFSTLTYSAYTLGLSMTDQQASDYAADLATLWAKIGRMYPT